MKVRKNNFFLFLNTFIILDDGSITSFFSCNKFNYLLGEVDFCIRSQKLNNKLDISFFYEKKEEYIWFYLYFDLLK